MPVLISLLRGINVGGNKMVKMDALRAVYESLGLRDVQTWLNSGNVVFQAGAADLARLSKRIEAAIERTFDFHCDVILRTTSDLRDVIARNPFAARRDINPSRLLVTFLPSDPGEQARNQVRGMKTDPEELWIDGREFYIYFPDGMARPSLSIEVIEKALKISGTGRNWNTTRKLLEIAEKLEGVRR